MSFPVHVQHCAPLEPLLLPPLDELLEDGTATQVILVLQDVP